MMLFEMGVADSYSIPFEFVDHSPDRPNDLKTYHQHPKYLNLKPSQYTDDTQRSLATAKTIAWREEFDPCAYVTNWQYMFRNYPRDGYSRRFQKYMEDNVESTPHTFIKGITKKADSNGSIMGCLPCGYLATVSEVKLAASIQALITHSADTVRYAQAMSLCVHYFLNNGKKDGLLQYLDENVDGGFSLSVFETYEATSKKNMLASHTSKLVLYLLSEFTSQCEILREAVNIGGDTDSVAALAVGIASCSKEYKSDLPVVLKDNLEFGDKSHHDMLRKWDALLIGRWNS